ncbi:hypothetical protein B0O99DRAFT_641252 [Bisporella sp. PMI_857]|nr:hypothetical protein B0O99DRAFT_641252 [Bisporella sp. PMI_857]
MVFRCPVCREKVQHNRQREVNAHILANEKDPAHAPHAYRLKWCVCGRGLQTPQARSKHVPTCGRAKQEEATRSGLSIDNLKSGSDSVAVRSQANSRPDIHTPLGNLPQSSLLTTSSKRHALIDVTSICPRVSHSPSPPQVLLVSENLFHNIKVYFENSCRNIDNHGTVRAPDGTELLYDLCNDFDSYCFTATMLIQKSLYVEFRRALTKASALVERILLVEHPRSLACFLEVFIHLIQTGLPEVTSLLRDFIKGMSAKVTRKGHPWGEICRLLGELDSESLDQAMAQIWKFITDIFGSELGTFNPFAVSVRLDYIKRVYGSTNYLEEERHLRGLLAQSGGIPQHKTPRMMLNLAHNLNRQGYYREAEEMALKVLGLLQKYEMYAGRIVETIESLKIVSQSQLDLGHILEAEQTMREAIRMIVGKWGEQHPWVPEFKNVLEGWLRGWGRHEDANLLRGEIEESMGKDDEQLDGVQGLLC